MMMNLFMIALIFIYSFSLLYYIADIIKRKPQYGIWAYRLLWIGGLLHTFIFVLQMSKQYYFPILTLFEVLYFYSLILVIITIMIHHVLRWELLEMATIFLGLITLVGAMSVGDSSPTISSTFMSRLLFLHILFSVISYSAFSLSAIFSFLYILHDFLLKRKIWNVLTRALPSLESLERYAFIANLAGIPILFIGLIIGSMWASGFYKWTFFFDPKVITSFIIVLIYSRSIVMRQKRKWMNIQLAVWNLVAFIMVVINFTIANIFWSFHRWF